MTLQTSSSQPCRRVSVFREIGLFDDNPCYPPPNFDSLTRPQRTKRSRRRREPTIERIDEEVETEMSSEDDFPQRHYPTRSQSTLLIPRSRTRVFVNRIFFLVISVVFLVHVTPLLGLSKNRLLPGVAAFPDGEARALRDQRIQKRANSPTDVCKRWSQQSAIINGTLYLYGGQATTSSSQVGNTWNNNFLSIDLTKSWQISSPPFNGLPQPSGPPAVANGYLWNSYDSLYLYGGEFSDTPPAQPPVSSLWEYNIKSSSWTQHSNPSTSSGKNSEPAGETVERAAEGAGFSVASLGLGWYFGGHLDAFTSSFWSQSTPRLYLRSFIEFTFPGYSNNGVDSLSSGKTAGSDGVWRNITQGGIQDQAGFTERADGILVWIPGFGNKGVILNLAGGTSDTFTQMNIIDVYDVANSAWYRQATSGPTPGIRVNPCAVVAAAADGSSYQVYMFGGQNLVPFRNQTQYNDMWILSVPSFTWIQINTTDQSTPYPRAGHTCNIWDGQMVVVGGYISKDISCESPGVYVFNASSLQWATSFNSISAGLKDNPFSQQLGQKGAGPGLEGSYGYTVPQAVYNVIGGSAKGGATATAPVATASDGPFATGKPSTNPVVGGTGSGTSGSSSGPHSNVNVGAAVAGAVAGFFFLIACYLAFCALVYRKQLQIYQYHVAMAHPGTPPPTEPDRAGVAGFMAGAWKRASFLPGRSSGKQSTEGSRFSNSNPSPQVHEATPAMGPYGQATQFPAQGASPAGSHTSLNGQLEPSYWGVLLHPRRSLRVINR